MVLAARLATVGMAGGPAVARTNGHIVRPPSMTVPPAMLVARVPAEQAAMAATAAAATEVPEVLEAPEGRAAGAVAARAVAAGVTQPTAVLAVAAAAAVQPPVRAGEVMAAQVDTAEPVASTVTQEIPRWEVRAAMAGAAAQPTG